MNKSDLDRAVAEETGKLLVDVAQVTDLFLKKVMVAVANGEPVLLPGFGKFTREQPRLANTGNLVQYKGEKTPRQSLGFRVQFSKSRTAFGRILSQEKVHGKARR